ncbi:hypothetical protein [Devosia sp. 2618]|uniref:hypothetical protein n=1 Tax=Devosia sp. 2618 TaxID=3156454 RepID=UPI00339B484C
MKKLISAAIASAMLIAVAAPAFAAPANSADNCVYKDASLCKTESIYSTSG